MVCPLCQSGIELKPDEDPNVTFAKHEQRECATIKQKKLRKQARTCAVQSCSKQLTSMNACKCPKCDQEFCLTHRYYEDHLCKGAPKAAGWFSSSTGAAAMGGGAGPAVTPGRTAAASGFLAALSGRSSSKSTNVRKAPKSTNRSPQSSGSARSTQASAKPRRAPGQDATAELRATAARRRQHSASTATDKLSAAEVPSNIPAVTSQPPGREVCPHCAARFQDVLTLVSHVEAQHPQQPTSTTIQEPQTSTGAIETCPQCGQQFHDVSQLVSHVEAAHSQSHPASNGPSQECSLQ
jgi:uncharacterized C2H2 Zn-finger protein